LNKNLVGQRKNDKNKYKRIKDVLLVVVDMRPWGYRWAFGAYFRCGSIDW